MQTREVEREIAALATRQHGVVGRWQLLGLGLKSSAIGRRIALGRLHEVHAGVYAVGHADVSLHGRWMAAVLASGPAETVGARAIPTRPIPPPLAVLSHRSAAALWGIRNPGDGPHHVTLPRKSRSSRQIRRHVAVLPLDEVTVRDGIPVTTVPRTILDLAATASVDQVEFALREAEYRHLHDALSLPALLARYPGRRGARVVRLALQRLTESPSGRPASPLEEVFVPFLARHRLPRPQINAHLEVAGHRCRVDCLWPAQRQVIEHDGWEGHSTPTVPATAASPPPATPSPVSPGPSSKTSPPRWPQTSAPS